MSPDWFHIDDCLLFPSVLAVGGGRLASYGYPCKYETGKLPGILPVLLSLNLFGGLTILFTSWKGRLARGDSWRY